MCVSLQRTKNWVCYNTKQEHKISQFINCNTKYTVYCIICQCNLIYIDSTIRPLKERTQEHIRAIRNNNDSYPLAVHYNTVHANSEVLQLRFHGIAVVEANSRGGDRTVTLRKMESKWLIKLRAIDRMLNTDRELHVFLREWWELTCIHCDSISPVFIIICD